MAPRPQQSIKDTLKRWPDCSWSLVWILLAGLGGKLAKTCKDIEQMLEQQQKQQQPQPNPQPQPKRRRQPGRRRPPGRHYYQHQDDNDNVDDNYYRTTTASTATSTTYTYYFTSTTIHLAATATNTLKQLVLACICMSTSIITWPTLADKWTETKDDKGTQRPNKGGQPMGRKWRERKGDKQDQGKHIRQSRQFQDVF